MRKRSGGGVVFRRKRRVSNAQLSKCILLALAIQFFFFIFALAVYNSRGKIEFPQDEHLPSLNGNTGGEKFEFPQNEHLPSLNGTTGGGKFEFPQDEHLSSLNGPTGGRKSEFRGKFEFPQDEHLSSLNGPTGGRKSEFPQNEHLPSLNGTTGGGKFELPQDEHLPSLNGTTEKLNAIPLSVFCKGVSAKVRPKYTVFKDALLAETKLYLPSSINCSALPRERDIFLTTRFNRGQRSTPKLELMVVPSAKKFEDFGPHLSCHERIYEPSILLSFINWPQYGHAMFNGVSLLWEIFSALFLDADHNIRLYAYGDSIDSHNRQKAQENSLLFDMKRLGPLMRMFSGQPVRALANLLKQSDRHPVCFSYLVVGLSVAQLDHYNFHAPLKRWREFSSAVKSHFNVKDPPRVNEFNLERVAPQDALGPRSNADKELGNMTAISWKDLPGRPRLTIVDRKSSRVIINVKDLQKIAVESGYFKSVYLVYPEEMSMEEQVRLMGVTDVLFGMDGTGLMNGIFLPEGGVVVHVRPFGCKEFLTGKGINFDRLFCANPGRVIRYESGERNSTRFATNVAEVPELVFNHNSSVTVGYRFSFILKQHTLIDPLAFRCILDTSNNLLHGVSVNWDLYRSCTRSVFL
ncbi:hypothetical protein SUGI_1030010 [Cryptomeria japonica]|nr:hypothetical protein SUGI_1030010 [Cryptomeria japonica]